MKKEALKTTLAIGWWVSFLLLCGVAEAELSFIKTMIYGGACLLAFFGCGKGLNNLYEKESNNVNAE